MEREWRAMPFLKEDSLQSVEKIIGLDNHYLQTPL